MVAVISSGPSWKRRGGLRLSPLICAPPYPLENQGPPQPEAGQPQDEGHRAGERRCGKPQPDQYDPNGGGQPPGASGGESSPGVEPEPGAKCPPQGKAGAE